MSETRDRLLDAALELFWSEGYQTTSLARVCEVAGANPGSLHYFFGTKQRLLEGALDRLRFSIGVGLVEPAWDGVDDPLERVFALLDAYRRNLVATGFTYGCPVGCLALELRDPPDDVRIRLDENFDAWIDVVRTCFEEARSRFAPDTDLDALSTFVLTTMEGGVMLARTKRSIRPFDQAVQMLRTHVELLGASAPQERDASTPYTRDHP